MPAVASLRGTNAVHNLPELEPTDHFAALPGLAEARDAAGAAAGHAVPGAALPLLREAVPDLRAALIGSGMPAAIATGDLVTTPYPTSFGLWRAARSPAPFVWLTSRLLVVQWDEPGGGFRTLLWCPTDHERLDTAPHLTGARSALPARARQTVHGSVLGHVRALGIDPADVDYLAFDNLQGQDLRRHLGTTRPAPDLGSPEQPLPGWFPNASLLVSAREWSGLRQPHPLQAAWYQRATFPDLPAQQVLVLPGDVQLGPGVALFATPGRTPGNLSLALVTDAGVWVSSGNGIAAECWAPRASRIPGVRRWAVEWEQEVVLDANTVEFAAQQYDAMVTEKLLADVGPEAPFPRCVPTRELTPSRWAPGLAPTFVHGGITHGRVRGSSVLPAPGGGRS